MQFTRAASCKLRHFLSLVGYHRCQSLRPVQVRKSPPGRGRRTLHGRHRFVFSSGPTFRVSFPCPAGKDATQAFYGLHRHEVLLRPQYARLQIGRLHGQEELIKPQALDDISKVPYAEPSWLVDGYFSPYYTPSHRNFQKAVRKFVIDTIYPEAVRCEENGRKASQEVINRMR